MNIKAVSLILFASIAAQPAHALITWKGRDGKAYSSVKDCFTNNPQCLPEQGRMMAGGGGKPDAAPAMSSSRGAAPALCKSDDGWMSPPPCASGQIEAAAPQ